MHAMIVIATIELVSGLAQTDVTLADRVMREGTDIAVTVNVDGPPVTLEHMLKATDLVIRGTIGTITGHLSDDGREIYRTYELMGPRVLFAAEVPQLAVPGMPTALTFRQPGGTVTIGTHTATITYDILANPREGMDVVLLLSSYDGRNEPAAAIGIFEVREGLRIASSSPLPGEHHQFDGMNVDEFVDKVLAARMAIR